MAADADVDTDPDCTDALAPEVDWLAHIDTDEFLLPARSLAEQLAAIDPELKKQYDAIEVD